MVSQRVSELRHRVLLASCICVFLGFIDSLQIEIKLWVCMSVTTLLVPHFFVVFEVSDTSHASSWHPVSHKWLNGKRISKQDGNSLSDLRRMDILNDDHNQGGVIRRKRVDPSDQGGIDRPPGVLVAGRSLHGLATQVAISWGCSINPSTSYSTCKKNSWLLGFTLATWVATRWNLTSQSFLTLW